jgi:hypothetical protein
LARVLLVLAVVVAGLLAFAYLEQRRLLYFPEREDRAAAERRARFARLEPWIVDGAFLGWSSPHPSGAARGQLLVFHGNAGSAVDRTYLRDVFQSEAIPFPLDVRLVEYPGYGPRQGTPSEPALVAAALEAARAARRSAPGPVILLGESLGSAIAAIAAAHDPSAADALILVTPLANLPAVARRHYPFVPRWMVRDRLEGDAALLRFEGPVAFLVAGRDEVVFPDLGVALYEARQGPKRLWTDPQAHHNDVDYDPTLPRWREMVEFAVGGGGP